MEKGTSPWQAEEPREHRHKAMTPRYCEGHSERHEAEAPEKWQKEGLKCLGGRAGPGGPIRGNLRNVRLNLEVKGVKNAFKAKGCHGSIQILDRCTPSSKENELEVRDGVERNAGGNSPIFYKSSRAKVAVVRVEGRGLPKRRF